MDPTVWGALEFLRVVACLHCIVLLRVAFFGVYIVVGSYAVLHKRHRRPLCLQHEKNGGGHLALGVIIHMIAALCEN